MNRIVPQFVVVAVITAIAPVGLLVAAAVWPSPAAQIPAHWNVTGAPELESSTTVLWISLVPAIVCCAVAVVCAIFLRSDAGRWGSAVGLGFLTLAGAFPALIWPVGQLTAGMNALNNQIGAPFLLYGVALVLGVVSFAIAATRAAPVGVEEGSETSKPTP